MKTFDVYLCSHEVKRPNGVRATQISTIAVERGPLDPYQPPEGAYIRYGPYLAASKSDAVAQHCQTRTNPRPLGRTVAYHH